MVNLRLLIVISISFFTTPLYATDKPLLKIHLSKDIAWQREQVMLTIEVITDDALSRLESKNYKQTGLTIIPYPLETIEETDTGSTRLKLKWAIFPFADKSHMLTLPRIRYRPSRGRPITLDTPGVTLTVNTLPIYVPPTMPVGKVSLSTQWQNGIIITSHKFSEWKIFVNTEHVVPATLPIITNQLKSTDSIHFLPIKKQVSLIKDTSGINHKQQYTTPLKALSFGKLDLPELVVQYFDPETSTIKTAHHKPPLVIVLHPWMMWLLNLIMLIVVILLSAISLPHIKHFLHKRLQKKQALSILQQADSYQQIRNALMQYALAKDWGDNMTLQDFSLHFKNTEHSKTIIKKVIKQLEYHEFSLGEIHISSSDIDKIKNTLYRLLNNHD